MNRYQSTTFPRRPRRSGVSVIGRAALGAFFVGVVLAGAFGFITGWFLMLAIGIIHADVLHAVVPVGYWTSYVLAVLLTIVFRGGSSSSR